MNKSELNIKTEEVLKSLEGIKEVNPGDYLFNKIMTEMNYFEIPKKERKFIFGYAAIIAVIIIVNIFSLLNLSKTKLNDSENILFEKSQEVQNFSKVYFSNEDTYNYR